jgi:hypothetical protein
MACKDDTKKPMVAPKKGKKGVNPFAKGKKPSK